MKRRIAGLLGLGMFPWVCLNASETATTTFRVAAKVEEFCEVIVPDRALGDFTAQGAATLLRATCTPNTTYVIGPTQRTSPGAAVNQRRAVSGALTSNHRLYSDSARSAISGNAAGMATVTGVGTGQAVDHTLFGGVPAVQYVPPGDYVDTLSVRVYY